MNLKKIPAPPKPTCPVCGADLQNPGSDRIAALFDLWKSVKTDMILLNMGQRMFAERLVKEYGYQKVFDAFVEACAETERMKLSYVRGILKGEYQKEHIKKEKAEAQAKARETQANVKIGGFDFSEFTKKGHGNDKASTPPQHPSPCGHSPQEETSEERRIKEAKFEAELLQNDPRAYKEYMDRKHTH
jgi:hypothetical protein